MWRNYANYLVSPRIINFVPEFFKRIAMFIVISIMFAGIAVGYLLRRVSLLQKLGHSITYTIYALLFLLGTSVGSNPQIIGNLQTLGLQALLFAIAATLGSVLMAWVVYRFFMRRGGRAA